MKKLILFAVLLISMMANAQKNEVKLDILDILVVRALDVSYERSINDESTIGVSAFINFEKEDRDFRYNEELQIVPYFRYFFGDYKIFDIYGELFGSLNFGEDEITLDNGTKDEESYTDFALGLGAGLKHVSKNGFVLDLNIGIGRNLFNTDISPEFVPRVGISVGKQF